MEVFRNYGSSNPEREHRSSRDLEAAETLLVYDAALRAFADGPERQGCKTQLNREPLTTFRIWRSPELLRAIRSRDEAKKCQPCLTSRDRKLKWGRPVTISRDFGVV